MGPRTSERKKMANICSNTLQITGNKEDIALFTKKITEQDKELIKLFTWLEYTDEDYGLWEESLETYSESISFSFGSQWCFPSKFSLGYCASRLLNSAHGSWEEPGMENYGKVSNCEYTSLTPLEYYTEFNPDFFEERQQIENLPYDKFLGSIEKNDSDDDYIYGYLEPLIIERIEKKDLPLFIEKKWLRCQNEFIKKLRRVT